MAGPNSSSWIISSSWLEAGDDRRGEAVAPVADRRAAGHHLGVGRGALEEAAEPVELGGAVERAEVGVVDVEAPDRL